MGVAKNDPGSGVRPDQPSSIPKDDAFHLLQNTRRRAVLRLLLEHEEHDVWQLRDVAEAVAAWEHDTTIDQLGSDQRKRVYISLYQHHMSKLDDHELIDYDKDRGTVELRPLARALEPYLGDGLDAPQSLHPDGRGAGSDDGRGLPVLGALLGR